MTTKRLIEIALGEKATKKESEEMAMKLLNWEISPKQDKIRKKLAVK